MLNKIRLIFLKLKEKGIKYVVVHSARYIKIVMNQRIDLGIRKVMSILTKRKALEDIIIIESHNDFDCNGGALYDFLLEKGYNDKYKIIWLIKNKTDRQLPANVETFFINKPSVKKNYYICIASFLLCDDVITDKVKQEQISIYCTHGGCTFKNVKGLIVVPPSIDYILSSSENYDPYMCNNYSIPYPNNKMLHIGFPSNDVFYKANINETEKITSKKYQKSILWMPTFRKSGGSGAGRNDSNAELPFGIPLIEESSQLERLNAYLCENDCVLIIKIHPMQDPSTIIELKNYSNICILDGETTKKLNVDVYRLMASSDALISDYSSAAYSFLMLNRPIGFVLSDLKDYKLGFSVDNIEKFLVGEKIYEYEEFEKFIRDVVSSYDVYKEQRMELLQWMYKFQDGNSCERLVKFMQLKKE